MGVNKAKVKSMWVKTKALPALVNRNQDFRLVEKVDGPRPSPSGFLMG